MKKTILAVYAVIFLLSAAAKIPIGITQPDTIKPITRTAPANSRVSSIPGLKTMARGTALNNKQVAVLGINPNQTLFTEEPKIINLINEITLFKTPVNLSFTPSQPCLNQDNCIFYNTTITDIQPGSQQWTFKRNAESKDPQIIKVMPKLQPNKDYLFVIDANVGFKSPGINFSINGYRINSSTMAEEFNFNMNPGKNQFTFIVHTNPDYKFVGIGPNCTYFALLIISHKPGDEFHVNVHSIRIKEINMN